MSCSSEMAEPIQILDAVWGVHSGEPKELCIRRGPGSDPPWEGAILGCLPTYSEV